MSKVVKSTFVCLVILVSLCSCNNIKYRELYGITDEFVEKLQTTYQSYGMLGGMEHTKYTEDKEYKVFPMGRLINVRIERYADDEEYENLRKAWNRIILVTEELIRYIEIRQEQL